VGGQRIAVIGQAFPRTSNANPQKYFFPDWSFGLREDEMIELVADIRANEKPDAVILVSHNGMDVDIKMASRISGIDAIFGGHTHDGMPKPIEVKNAGGTNQPPVQSSHLHANQMTNLERSIFVDWRLKF
jgi:sulfur-oxidizing protein SoxB